MEYEGATCVLVDFLRGTAVGRADSGIEERTSALIWEKLELDPEGIGEKSSSLISEGIDVELDGRDDEPEEVEEIVGR